MSEYQYYEFLAVDRSLTDEERAALRTITTRATITPWRLQNVYHWGSFKGDPLDLMTRYFDLFVYVANWGTSRFMVRLPLRVLPAEAVTPYDAYDVLSTHVRDEHIILDMLRHDEDGYGWIEDEEAESWMPVLAPLRIALAGGDYRALYIAWLAGIDLGEMDREATEPPLPAGLGQTDASLDALAEFLGVDRDLLAAAAEASPPRPEAPSPQEVRAWLHSLPAEEKDAVLERLVIGEEPHLRAGILQRYRQAQGSAEAPAPPRRLVGDILDRAAEIREARLRAEAEAEARRRAAEAHARAVARAAHLDGIAGQQEALWKEVDVLIAAVKPAAYDRAVEILVDLRDLAEREGTTPRFRMRLDAIREEHARKPSFLARLAEGLRRPA